MPDFETMPIGTRAAMRETAELLRQYTESNDLAEAAAKLEALLAQPGVVHIPERPIPDEVKRLLQPRPIPLHNGSGVPGDEGLPLEGV